MPRTPIAVALLASFTVTVPAQDDFAAFRKGMEERLRQHPFFSKVSFTLVDRPPFLFCVERSPNDEKDYELAIVNGYLPFLLELTAQWEQHYRAPGELVRSPAAGGYALAVLSSAGRYVDFRTAIGEPSLAFARAHYTPSVRLAVTYQDTFARHNTNPEERHALLHEFVHALQHAHAENDQMPKPVWFNEGLADYRAACSNIASSLRQPPVQSRHVTGLAFGYANPAGRHYVAPIADLVAANSYQEVLDLALARNQIEVPGEAVLGIFYSQAEMFVRFLHEGEQGKHRDGFVRYLRAAEHGASGLAAFQQAFGVPSAAALAALEAEWLRWLDGVLRERYPSMRDLTKAPDAGGGGSVPMSPPVSFPTDLLTWEPADLDERLAGVRRLCANGDYEAASSLLPAAADGLTADQVAFVARERQRIAALVTLRDDALQDLQQNKGTLSVEVDARAVRGKVVRREEQQVVLLVGRVETPVPLTAVDPEVLLLQARRMKRFEGKERWLEIWTRWLKGDSLASLGGLLKLEYSTIADLRRDLTGDLGPEHGAVAAAWIEMMRMPQSDEAPQAAAALERLRELLHAHGRSALLQRHKPAIDQLARAFAERAFRADDLEALGVRGTTEQRDDGSVAVVYGDAQQAPAADFTPLLPKDREALRIVDGPISYAGPSGLTAAQQGYQLIGSTWLRWVVPLRGKQVVEVQFVVEADFVPDFGIAVCAAQDRFLMASPTGGVEVFDAGRELHEPIGGGAQLMVGKQHRLRLVHDGQKALRVFLDDKQTAHVQDVGRMTGGEVWLRVHSATAAQIRQLSIEGTPSPTDPQQLRDRFVARVLSGLWP